jgi:DNA-binding LacI/PurR family transcriptional regulator
VRHLFSLGHRDIVYIYAEALPPAQLRLSGYLDAMRQLNLTPRVIEMSGDYTEESGANAARILLGQSSLPSAIVASNDQSAIEVIHVLRHAGVRVPDQVSVTGFDDSRFARLSSVDLTTARQDPAAMGSAAVRAAVRRIDDPNFEPEEFVIMPQLIVRGTSGRPAAKR